MTPKERYQSIRYFHISEEYTQPGILFVKSWCTISNPREVYRVSDCKIINGRELWMN